MNRLYPVTNGLMRAKIKFEAKIKCRFKPQFPNEYYPEMVMFQLKCEHT